MPYKFWRYLGKRFKFLGYFNTDGELLQFINEESKIATKEIKTMKELLDYIEDKNYVVEIL